MADTLTDQARERARNFAEAASCAVGMQRERLMRDADLLADLAAEYVRLTEQIDRLGKSPRYREAIELLREAEGRCVQLTEQLAEAEKAHRLTADKWATENKRANDAEAENTRLREPLEEIQVEVVLADDLTDAEKIAALFAVIRRHSSIARAALAGEPTVYDGRCHGDCGREYANFNCPECRALAGEDTPRDEPAEQEARSEAEWESAYDHAMQWRDWQTCDILLDERETADWYLNRDRAGEDTQP